MYREHREVPSRLPLDVMQLIGKWIAPLVRISVAALGWVRWPTLLSKSRYQDWNAVAPSRVKVGGLAYDVLPGRKPAGNDGS